MRPETRAVVFDLDDTLYPYRRFLLSGFAAVAERLRRTHGADRRRAFRALAVAHRRGSRGREIQQALMELRLPAVLVPALVDVIHSHQPNLRLPPATAAALAALRDDGWRLGVLTNGPRAIQARKVMALGLTRFVDTIVYAREHGDGGGKPDPATFAEVTRRLAVLPSRTVVVGDDERCDIAGALHAGIQAVRCTAWIPDAPTQAGACVGSLAQLRAVVDALVPAVEIRHVA